MEKFGLGPGIIGRMEILPYARLFRIAARFHDIAYERGGSEVDKRKADYMFLRLMNTVCKNKLQSLFARFYYSMVRDFGWTRFNYHITIYIGG